MVKYCIMIEPAKRKEESTEQKQKIVHNTDKISKEINRNIEKVMMERAVISK